MSREVGQWGATMRTLGQGFMFGIGFFLAQTLVQWLLDLVANVVAKR